MPDETNFRAVPAMLHPGAWLAWYRDKPGGGLFVREANGYIVRYASESEAKDSAWFAYCLVAWPGRGGVQLELPL